MKRLNFVKKADFPLSSTWLDFLHKNNEELASVIVSLVGGSNCIVAGMEIGDDGYCSDGYFVLNGKLYQFRRSLVDAYIVVKTTPIQVQIGTENYTPAVDEWCEFSSTNAGFGIYYRVEDFRTILRVNYNEITNRFKTIEPIHVSKQSSEGGNSNSYNLVVRGLPDKFVSISGYVKIQGVVVANYDIPIPGIEFDGINDNYMLGISTLAGNVSAFGNPIRTIGNKLSVTGGFPLSAETVFNISMIAKIK